MFQLADARDAFRRRAGDRETPDQIIGDEIRIDSLFEWLRDIKAGHEPLYSRDCLRRNGFQSKAKIVVRPIGQARAHETTRPRSVFIHADHARGHDVDLRRVASRCARAFVDPLPRPFDNLEIEAGPENYAVGDSARESQSARTFSGDVDRHRQFSDAQIYFPFLPLFAARNRKRFAAHEVADRLQSSLELSQLGRAAPEAIDRAVSRAESQNEAPL